MLDRKLTPIQKDIRILGEEMQKTNVEVARLGEEVQKTNVEVTRLGEEVQKTNKLLTHVHNDLIDFREESKLNDTHTHRLINNGFEETATNINQIFEHERRLAALEKIIFESNAVKHRAIRFNYQKYPSF